MEKKKFKSDGLDISEYIYNKMNDIVRYIENKQEISKEEATKRLITSRTFKRFINVKNDLWMSDTEKIVNAINSENIEYYFYNKDVTENVRKTIVHLVKDISRKNHMNTLEAASIFVDSSVYDELTKQNSELCFLPSKEIEDGISLDGKIKKMVLI